MSWNYYMELDDRLLKSLPQFAGMSIEEISEWIEQMTEKGHIRWAREYAERLEKERKEDEKYCETDKNVVDPKTSVQTEDCVRITADQVDKSGFVSKDSLSVSEPFIKLSVGDKRVYVSKDLFTRSLHARKRRSVWD